MLSCNSLTCVHPYMCHIYGRGVCIFVVGSSGRRAGSTYIPGVLCVFAPRMTFVCVCLIHIISLRLQCVSAYVRLSERCMLSCGLLTCAHSSMRDITACCVYLLWDRLDAF